MTAETQLLASARFCKRAVLTLLAAILGVSTFSIAQERELLDPEKAFRISTRPLDERSVEVQFEIAAGYYMYRDRFKFETTSGKMLADLELPKGKVKQDPIFGATEIYRELVRIKVPLTPDDIAKGHVKLKVTSQGCADIGVCYTPLEQLVEVRLAGGSSGGTVDGLSQTVSWIEDLPRALRSHIEARGPSALSGGGFMAMLATFFALGLTAGFARPSASVIAQSQLPAWRVLDRVALRFLMYTVGGTAAGVAGAAAFTRLPGEYVSAALAVAFAGLAATTLLARNAAATVVTAGSLLVVAKWGDALLGAAGLGLLALSISLAPSLARWRHAAAAARWSHALLGFAASALAVWAASPLLAVPLRNLAWGTLFVMGGVYLRTIHPLPPYASAEQRFAKGIGFVALAAGVIMLILAAGGRDLFAPTAKLSPSRSAAVAETRFERVADLREFEARVRSASSPTMLDFYADWCVSCKEMERFTFSDPAVRERMLKMHLLQVDVTHHTPADQEFLRRFGLFGPPAILFFDAAGNEMHSLRVIGYQPAARFVKVLDAALHEDAPAAAQGGAK